MDTERKPHKPTRDQQRAALVWGWLRKAKAPDEVKSAFKALAQPYINRGVADNLNHWQPPFQRDEYLEE